MESKEYIVVNFNEIKYQSELILLMKHLGKKLIAIDQVQFCS